MNSRMIRSMDGLRMDKKKSAEDELDFKLKRPEQSKQFLVVHDLSREAVIFLLVRVAVNE